MVNGTEEYFFNGPEASTANNPAANIDFPPEGNDHQFISENNNYKGSENVKRFSVNNLLQLAADCHLGAKTVSNGGEFVQYYLKFLENGFL